MSDVLVRQRGISEKKTQIVKLSRGFTYLKTRYYLTETGRVVKKADHDCIVRERRKLKKLHRMYVAGAVTMDQIITSYMSWRGPILRHDAYRSTRHMDALFYSLYSTKPWKILRNGV